MRVIGTENLAQTLGVARETVLDWHTRGLPILKRSPGAPVPNEYESSDVISWLAEQRVGAHPAWRIERERVYYLREQLEQTEERIARTRKTLRADLEQLAPALEKIDSPAARLDLVAAHLDEILKQIVGNRFAIRDGAVVPEQVDSSAAARD